MPCAFHSRHTSQDKPADPREHNTERKNFGESVCVRLTPACSGARGMMMISCKAAQYALRLLANVDGNWQRLQPKTRRGHGRARH
mmetsp:Transcript_58318/g.155004  ORF Transcript_58318/g.155004 Transcript_58318/m.155004 type:complete len:85 (-) Transcript_58318:126-380(-)